MRADVSAREILSYSYLLHPDGMGSDPFLSMLAECVDDIRHHVTSLGGCFRDITQIYALSAIVVELAVETGEHKRVAALLRNSADILELEAAETNDYSNFQKSCRRNNSQLEHG